jgi:hypothetical protein
MHQYLVIPTTERPQIILMPVSESLIRALYKILYELEKDPVSIASITIRQVENDQTPEHAYLYVISKTTKQVASASIITIRSIDEITHPSNMRLMVSSLWTFNSSTHPTLPDRFIIEEENDKMTRERLAYSQPLYISVLRDIINRNLDMLGLQPPWT